MARLSAKLPEGDGLSAHDAKWIADPHTPRVAIVLLDCPRSSRDFDANTEVPVLRVRRAEVITNKGDAVRLLDLLRRENERRTGQTVLPLELEEDLRATVDGVEFGGDDLGGEGADGDPHSL